MQKQILKKEFQLFLKEIENGTIELIALPKAYKVFFIAINHIYKKENDKYISIIDEFFDKLYPAMNEYGKKDREKIKIEIKANLNKLEKEIN